MKKIYLISIFTLLIINYATGLVRDSINYYALPSDFPNFAMKEDKQDLTAFINFYLLQPGTPESISVVALMPADYNDRFNIRSSEYVRKVGCDSSNGKSTSNYHWWGEKDKELYYQICDSMTNIIYHEFASKGLFKLVAPHKTRKACDSIYCSFEDQKRDLWDRWFYPYDNSTDSIDDEKTIELFSQDILKSLNSDAYVVVTINPNLFGIYTPKKNTYEYRSQIFLRFSIIGPVFNVLWSAQIPITRQLRSVVHLSDEKKDFQEKIIGIGNIDYNLTREGVRRSIALLKTNKASNRFRF